MVPHATSDQHFFFPPFFANHFPRINLTSPRFPHFPEDSSQHFLSSSSCLLYILKFSLLASKVTFSFNISLLRPHVIAYHSDVTSVLHCIVYCICSSDQSISFLPFVRMLVEVLFFASFAAEVCRSRDDSLLIMCWSCCFQVILQTTSSFCLTFFFFSISLEVNSFMVPRQVCTWSFHKHVLWTRRDV